MRSSRDRGAAVDRDDRAWRHAAACPGGAGCGAPGRSGSPPASPSGWTCRRSSAACWPPAASASRRRLISWSRRCARCCRTRRSWSTWTSRPTGSPMRCAGGETVAVFGDYDVDGACSAALMVSFLRALGCTVHHHVPDRIKEGYGPNAPALTVAGGPRRQPDRLRRLRHRRGGGAVRRGRPGRRDRAGPPQGRGHRRRPSWRRSIRTGWMTAPA